MNELIQALQSAGYTEAPAGTFEPLTYGPPRRRGNSQILIVFGETENAVFTHTRAAQDEWWRCEIRTLQPPRAGWWNEGATFAEAAAAAADTDDAPCLAPLLAL